LQRDIWRPLNRIFEPIFGKETDNHGYDQNSGISRVSDKSSHDTVEQALQEAAKTVHGITGVDVTGTTAKIENDRIVEYHANDKFAFKVSEDRRTA
jgi:dodecin